MILSRQNQHLPNLLDFVTWKGVTLLQYDKLLTYSKELAQYKVSISLPLDGH